MKKQKTRFVIITAGHVPTIYGEYPSAKARDKALDEILNAHPGALLQSMDIPV